MASLRDTITSLPATLAGFLSRGGRAVSELVTGQSSKPLWPPVSENARRLRYERNALVYAGRHDRVFTRYLLDDKGVPVESRDKLVAVEGEDFHFTRDPKRPYIVCNLCSRTSDLLAERAFAEGVQVGTPEGADADAAVLAMVAAMNNLRSLHLLACVGASWRGDSMYEVSYEAATQRILVSLVDPAICFPETHPLDTTRALAWNIDQLLTAGRDTYYLWRKRHELRDGIGWVLNKLYRLTKDGQGYHVDFTTDEVPLETHPTTALLAGQEETNTGVRGLLVVHVPNRPNPMALWGTSDYSFDLLSLQGEIDNRLTQRSDVLDKFVEPWQYGPDLADEKGAVNARAKYIPVPPDASAPIGVVTWDAQLGAVEAALKDCREAFAMTAGVDTASLTPREAGGAPASGRALRLEQMNTGDSARQKQSDFEAPLKQLYAIITQLAAQPNHPVAGVSGRPRGLDPSEITLTFGDGLPSMSIEDAEEQALLLENGLTERAAALKVLHGLSDAAAEEMAARIEGKQGGLPAVPQVAFGSGIRRIGAQTGAE